MDKENECVCKTCDIHCECDLHKQYEETNCERGKNPISYCEMKANKEKQ